MQINFGVILNESMADEVKITVIATGFQRETLPEINRRAAAAEPVVTAFPEPAYHPPAEVEEPVREPEPVAAAEAEAEPEAAVKEETMVLNDLELPAVLRRNRQMFQ